MAVIAQLRHENFSICSYIYKNFLTFTCMYMHIHTGERIQMSLATRFDLIQKLFSVIEHVPQRIK